MTKAIGAPPVVVFGASGFVGQHLRPTLDDGATRVVIVSRQPVALSSGETLVQGDLMSPASLAPRLPRGAVVVNLAFDPRGGRDVNVQMADGLAALCAATGAVRVVHLSTAMVVGLVDERPVSETTVCRPRTDYQRTKLEVETRLQSALPTGCPLVILRPTAVFGADGQNLRKLVTDLTTRPWYENYLRLCLFGDRPLNLVPVETVVAAVRFAMASAAAPADGVYLVADDDAPGNNFHDVEQTVRVALGLPAYPCRRLPVPTVVLAALLRLTGRLSFDPRTVFSRARLDAAGFVPPVSFDEALGAYVSRVRAGCDASGDAS